MLFQLGENSASHMHAWSQQNHFCANNSLYLVGEEYRILEHYSYIDDVKMNACCHVLQRDSSLGEQGTETLWWV